MDFADKNEVITQFTLVLSKTDQPGLRNVHSKHKVVAHYEDIRTSRTFYNVYTYYMEKTGILERQEETGPFWVTPNPNWAPNTSAPWVITNKQIGINQFNILIKRGFNLAQLKPEKGKLTLRSIRSTIVTQLDEVGENIIPKSAVKMRTGHKTDAGMRAYERPNKASVQRKLSSILINPRLGLQRFSTLEITLVVLLFILVPFASFLLGVGIYIMKM